MPTVPSLPPQMLQQAASSGGMPTTPDNFLMAAADMHSKGEFQSAPVPTGKDLQTGKRPSRSRHLQMVK